MKKLASLVFVLLMTGSYAWSQNNDDNQDIFNDIGKEGEVKEDTSSESTTSAAGEGETKKPAKPFIRIQLPLDTVTNLVTYTEIIEQSTSAQDSLYIRAKRWAMATFARNGEKPKEIIVSDVSVDDMKKITIKGSIDAWVYINKYSKRGIGYHDFIMYVWIKEGRYRYSITHLVNESKMFPGDKELPARTYFEYYNTTTINPQGADSIARSADADLKKLIEAFKMAMKDPIEVDEGAW